MNRKNSLLVVAFVKFFVIALMSAALGWSASAAAQTYSFSEFPNPTDQPYGIAAGPDGAMWFVEYYGNKIGRITTDGAITEFTVPTPNSTLLFIAAGPDGALWFTNYSGNKIGRITTAGVITEFPVPTTNGGPYGIVAGPDDALWFTEFDGNKIGRITTAGNITEFSLPTATKNTPYGIVSGPDGALWFTENDSSKIGRITTAGNITEFPLPTANSFPTGITTGPDGALWFTEYDGNKIGRITTAGIITEFPVPTASGGPFGIAMGLDGTLWFTEYRGRKIGRLMMPMLQVSPMTSITASGPQGGPFSPLSFQYQLSASLGSVNYSITGIPTWLYASFTSGTATTLPVTVTFSLTNVASLNPGSYNGIITFTNTSNSLGSTNRTATLSVSVRAGKDDCKKGGWKNFTSRPGPFKNQGQCVSYFEPPDKIRPREDHDDD